MFSQELLEKSRRLLEGCRRGNLSLVTAESCTGGLVAGCLTAVPGASDVFTRGFITYANEAKTDILGVPEALLAQHGAVSEEVARAMAEGAKRTARADLALAVTGIAGPASDMTEKPVGLVHMAAAGAETHHERHQFSGNRDEIRLAAVAAVLELGLKALGDAAP
ncbi:MAG: CinA family protein [Alphaproteobacteria bacterium]|nr:CinA family protein [Alphaproteobacteria bacterium]